MLKEKQKERKIVGRRKKKNNFCRGYKKNVGVPLVGTLKTNNNINMNSDIQGTHKGCHYNCKNKKNIKVEVIVVILKQNMFSKI